MATGAVALAFLALAAAAALFISSVHYQHEVASLADAVSDLRALEELQVNLLIHQRESSQLVRGEDVHTATQERAEAALHHWLTKARRHSLDASEPVMLGQLEQALDRYWAEHDHSTDEAARAPTGRQDEPALERALAAIRSFTDHHYQQSEAMSARARRLARLSLWGSAGLAAGLVIVVSVFLLLTKSLLYLPLLMLRDRVSRAASGEEAGPAPEVGARELREIGKAINTLRASLAQQEHLRQTFLAGVAHDLRNPLAALKAASALGAHGQDERQQRVSAVIRRQVDRMNRMLEDLLACASIEAGELRLALRPCDLRSAVEEVVALHHPLAPGITLELPSSSVPVVCDPQRIEQAVGNLVSNAIKHGANAPIRVRLAAEGEEAVISVEDRGPGIDAAVRKKLFQPFCRSAGQGRSSGSGLGLFVARRIVEAHRGRLELADGEPGRGCTFRVHLRRAPAEQIVPLDATDLMPVGAPLTSPR